MGRTVKDTIGTAVSRSLYAETMSLSFGDFKKNEISELTQNKDPLGLNSDIESNHTTKSNKSEVPFKCWYQQGKHWKHFTYLTGK